MTTKAPARVNRSVLMTAALLGALVFGLAAIALFGDTALLAVGGGMVCGWIVGAVYANRHAHGAVLRVFDSRPRQDSVPVNDRGHQEAA